MFQSLFIAKVLSFSLKACFFVRGVQIKPVGTSLQNNVAITKTNVKTSWLGNPSGEYLYQPCVALRNPSGAYGTRIDVLENKSTKTKITKLTRIQKDVLYGTLLGDASLQTENGGRTYRLRFTQGEANKAYLFHIYEIFKDFILTEPKFNAANKTWYFNTRQNACFRFYGKMFYDVRGVKKVPRSISKWLSLRSMAYWYCDDGSAKDKKTSPAFRLCTDSFSKQDVDRLVVTLQDRFQVNAKVFENRPNQYRIYIGASDASKFSSKGDPLNIRDKDFAKQFLPYIIPEMLYKIPPRWISE